MFQLFRERLTLLLIGFLPFHALLVTAGTKFLLGPGHAPLPMLALWKEGLLAVILLLAIFEIIVRITNDELRISKILVPDLLDGLIFALLAIALVLPKTNFLFGFKYDFVPLIAFMVLRRMHWSQEFCIKAERTLLGVGGIVALYGIATLFLPQGFFTALGYSDAHSLYNPEGPLAAFQQISGSSIRRIQSTFSGPNQFGIWLLIPLSVCAARISNFGFRMRKIPQFAIRPSTLLRAGNSQFFVLGGLLLLALMLTFSRSAWIAAFIIAFIAASASGRFPKRVMIAGVGAFVVIAVVLSLLLPTVFVRSISLVGHLERPMQAIRTMAQHPLGLGLGAAGPAANRTHEPCVFLERDADASWAASNPNLCVFVGSNQVQPAGHACDCPLLPENWYLQIGVEMGVPGFALYLVLIVLVINELRMTNYELRKINSAIRHSEFVFLIFLGISVAALFLHAWEDAAVAYTVWVLVATILHSQPLRSKFSPR